jgi:hypothetical protein
MDCAGESALAVVAPRFGKRPLEDPADLKLQRRWHKVSATGFDDLKVGRYTTWLQAQDSFARYQRQRKSDKLISKRCEVTQIWF